MQSKTTIAALVALSFVAGSVVTGTSAFASSNNGKPFEEIWDAIRELREAIETEPDDEPGLTKTYVKIDNENKKVFCDVGDFAVNGGKIGESLGRPINADGDLIKDKEVVRGWENTSSKPSFVVCVDTKD